MREYGLRYATRQAAALAFAGLLSTPLLATTPVLPAGSDAGALISGPARVIDGDTIEIHGVRVRLEGIDAPEVEQTCGRALAGTWPCGKEAAQHLALLLIGREVRCEDKGRDVYRRILGLCFSDGLDINAYMVRNGLAWAFVKYSRAYVETEAQARALELGIWQGPAEPAWEYRARRWLGMDAQAPEGCAIKGNISRNGRIYHRPGDPYYGRTRIDETRGERWFCTEVEAAAAGWRAAGVPH